MIRTARTADSLVVATHAELPLRVALSGISSLELNRGRNAARGAKRGFLGGAALGFAMPYLICDGASCRQTGGQRFARALRVSALYSVIGAYIGHKRGSDEWVSYPLTAAAIVPPRSDASGQTTRTGIP